MITFVGQDPNDIINEVKEWKVKNRGPGSMVSSSSTKAVFLEADPD